MKLKKLPSVAKPKILIVEDDPSSREIMRRALAKSIPGASILDVFSASKASEALSAYRPDLVILDWMLGRDSGAELCSRLKAGRPTRDIPVILVTGKRVKPVDEYQGLSCGADVYLTKPFELKRLTGCAKALLQRHGRLYSPGILHIGPMVLNFQERQAGTSKGFCRLSKSLFRLLWHLALRYPKPVSGSWLIWRVWKGGVRDNEAAVAASRLNRRLALLGCSVRWEKERGYRLCFEP